jgi:hypothetical protein
VVVIDVDVLDIVDPSELARLADDVEGAGEFSSIELQGQAVRKKLLLDRILTYLSS